jgi:hypothetical protein
MKNRFVQLMFALSIMAFFATNTNAAKLNLTLGDDLISDQYDINVADEVYYSNGPGSLEGTTETLKGYLSKYFVSYWLAPFNNLIDGKHLIDNYHGSHSQISLGYIKNGANISPPSCQNIRLNDVTNIVFTETGCTVS